MVGVEELQQASSASAPSSRCSSKHVELSYGSRCCRLPGTVREEGERRPPLELTRCC